MDGMFSPYIFTGLKNQSCFSLSLCNSPMEAVLQNYIPLSYHIIMQSFCFLAHFSCLTLWHFDIQSQQCWDSEEHFHCIGMGVRYEIHIHQINLQSTIFFRHECDGHEAWVGWYTIDWVRLEEGGTATSIRCPSSSSHLHSTASSHKSTLNHCPS